MTDLEMVYERHIPIDLSSGRRHSRVVAPPPLRLYNPSRLIAFRANGAIKKYTFSNPFTSDNIMRTAYSSILGNPFGHAVDFDRDTRNTRPNNKRFWRLKKRFNIDMDPWGGWVFNEYKDDVGNSSNNSSSTSGEPPFYDYFDTGRKLFNSIWAELNPFQSNFWTSWDDDMPVFESDLVLSDLNNYRIAKHGHCSPMKPGVYGVMQHDDDRWDVFNDIRSVWSTDSGMDSSDDDRSYKVRFRLPGVNEEDVNISINGGVLTVKAKASRVEHGNNNDGNNNNNNESTVRYSHQFHHSLSLPRDAMERRAKANLANGTLTISIPKRCGKTSWD